MLYPQANENPYPGDYSRPAQLPPQHLPHPHLAHPAHSYADAYALSNQGQQRQMPPQQHPMAYASSALNLAAAVASEHNAQQYHLTRMMMLANQENSRREYEALQLAAAAAAAVPHAARHPTMEELGQNEDEESPRQPISMAASLLERGTKRGYPSSWIQPSEWVQRANEASVPLSKLIAGEFQVGRAPAAPKPPKKPKPPPKAPPPKKEKKKDIKWRASLDELAKYKEEYGNCLVPRGYPPSPRLASWVAEQRKQYKLLQIGKQSSITPQRIDLLNSLDFAWNAQEAAWEKHIEDLKSYKEEYGDCLVPLNHPDYPKLGLWVKEQRRHYTLLRQGKPSHMTEERAQTLQKIGFCWDTHEAIWGERLVELKQYKERWGDCLVPINYGKLGTWVHHQRRQRKKYKRGEDCHITGERIQALDRAGFAWDPRTRTKKRPNYSEDESSEGGDSDSSLDLGPKCSIKPVKRKRSKKPPRESERDDDSESESSSLDLRPHRSNNRINRQRSSSSES